MKILLFEWLSGGGLLLDGLPLKAAASLLSEGAAMALALAEDWLGCGHQVTLLLDRRYRGPVPLTTTIPIAAPASLRPALVREATLADAVMVIAPETGQRLQHVLDWLALFADRLLCPSGEAVRIGSSKDRTARCLEAAGVQRPYGRLLMPGEHAEWRAEPTTPRSASWIIKPDDGAGSEGVRLVGANEQRLEPEALADSACRRLLAARPSFREEADESASAPGSTEGCRLPEAAQRPWRLEHHLRGHPVSICVVAGPAGTWFLPPTLQRFAHEAAGRESPRSLSGNRQEKGSGPNSLRRLHEMRPDPGGSRTGSKLAGGKREWPGPWVGFDWPLPWSLAERAVGLAEKALAALPRFTGPAGFDMVLSEADPAEDRIVDFNPRLTSSWAGLRQLLDANLGEQLLAVVNGQPPPKLWPVLPQLQWRLQADREKGLS